jgi:hypothetical protein
MTNRKLRIAFSATCLIACVLLIVLWVRSYWWTYGVNANDGIQEFGISVECGALVAAFGSVPKLSRVHFYWESQPVTPDLDMPGLMGFYCGTHPYGGSSTLLLLPLWLFGILAATAGVTPWIIAIRLRFTLRTLLVAITAVAVLFGVVVWVGK